MCNARLRAVPVAGLLVMLMGPWAPASADQALATSKQCMACHGIDRRLVGPSMVEVAARYRERNDAAALLAGKIVKGSTGAWGPVPMPPQGALVKADEAAALAAWIIGLR